MFSCLAHSRYSAMFLSFQSVWGASLLSASALNLAACAWPPFILTVTQWLHECLHCKTKKSRPQRSITSPARWDPLKSTELQSLCFYPGPGTGSVWSTKVKVLPLRPASTHPSTSCRTPEVYWDLHTLLSDEILAGTLSVKLSLSTYRLLSSYFFRASTQLELASPPPHPASHRSPSQWSLKRKDAPRAGMTCPLTCMSVIGEWSV